MSDITVSVSSNTIDVATSESAIDVVFTPVSVVSVAIDNGHARLHVLATATGLGPDHTMSGGVAGYVLRASGATTALFAQLDFADISGTIAANLVTAGTFGGGVGNYIFPADVDIPTLYGGALSAGDITISSTSHATKGSILFGGANGLVFDEENNRLSLGGSDTTSTIGGVTKDHGLSMHNQGGQNAYDVTFHRHSATSGAFLAGSRSRGSEASEAIVQDGDVLLNIVGVGYDGTDYEFGAAIEFEVDGVPGDGDMPGRIKFQTTPAGSGTPVDRGLINAVGLFDWYGAADFVGDVSMGALTASTGSYSGNVTISKTTSNAILTIQTVADSFLPALDFYRATAGPAAISSGQTIGTVRGWSHDGTGYFNTVGVEFESAQAHTVSAHGTRINFSVTPNGSTIKGDVWQVTDGGGLRPLNGPQDLGGSAAANRIGTGYFDALDVTGAVSMDTLTLNGGSIALKEITTPAAVVTYGKMYTKTDNKVYFQDGAGVEHEIAFV